MQPGILRGCGFYAMEEYDVLAADSSFETMRLMLDGRVARIVFDNPPMNLLDARMFNALDRLGQ